jgi:hypothetical protein
MCPCASRRTFRTADDGWITSSSDPRRRRREWIPDDHRSPRAAPPARSAFLPDGPKARARHWWIRSRSSFLRRFHSRRPAEIRPRTGNERTHARRLARFSKLSAREPDSDETRRSRTRIGAARSHAASVRGPAPRSRRSVVRTRGLEPPRSYEHLVLRQARLPASPRPQR